MNYMKQVAAMLGVEMGEEFEIIFPPPVSCHATAIITNDGASVVETDVYDLFNFKIYLLQNLLKGAYTIKRKSWKPKINEDYYSVVDDGFISENTWFGDCVNIIDYKLGNCYRTFEEAEANRDKWLAFYASDEVLEV